MPLLATQDVCTCPNERCCVDKGWAFPLRSCTQDEIFLLLTHKHLNRSTYTSIPRGRLDYPCYAEYLGDDVNADNGPWPEVAFVTFAMGSETCVSQPNRSTSTPRSLMQT